MVIPKRTPEDIFDQVLAAQSEVQQVEEKSTTVFQDGQPVVKPVAAEMPKVTVEGSQAVAPVTEQPSEAEEIAAGVPEEVVQAEQQVAEVVETAVPPVVAEERAEETETQEPPTDTTGKSAAVEIRDELVTSEGEASATEAAKVEEVWDPLVGEIEEE